MTDYPKAFEDAIQKTLQHEGRFVDDPDDPGGATNFGVSLRFVKGELDGTEVVGVEFDLNGDGKVDVEDIRNMTRDMAIAVYFSAFWDKRFEQMDDLIAEKYFDFSINMSKKQATMLVQRACISAGFPVSVDGGLGPETMGALEKAEPACVLAALKAEAAAFYRLLAVLDPVKEKFLKGWLKRAYS